MPALKNLFHHLRRGKEKCEEPLAVEEERPALKRANAKLQKRNKSNVRLCDGVGTVHDGFRPRFSRQNSFEPGQSVKDFDAVASFDFQKTRLKPKALGTDIFKGSSKAEDGEGSIDWPLLPGWMEVGAAASWLRGLGLEVHPDNLGDNQRGDEAGTSNFLLDSPVGERRQKPRVVNGSPEDNWNSDDSDSPQTFYSLHSAPIREKRKIPSIRELNWDDVGEDEVRDIAEAYNASANLRVGGASPVDSAVALPGRERSLKYSRKGKRRETGPVAGMNPNSWLDVPVRSAKGVLDRRSLSEGPAERAKVELRKTRSFETLESEGQSQELEKALLKEAWEMEHARFLEQKQKQEKEDRVQAEILEQQLLKEERERIERLEEDLIQQLLREEEEERHRIEEQRLAEERARQKDCCVCGDTQEPDHFPSVTANCEHDPNTCKTCLEAWMTSELDTKGSTGLKCPECPQTLTHAEVQAAASASTFAAYDKLTIRSALGDLDEFAWCLSPTCASGQLNVDNNHFMECAACGYKQCLSHRVAWHTGETCEAYDYRVSGEKRRDEERKEEEMLDGLSKKCPGTGCGWRIQKIDGCEHMTCKRCRFEFCWICLASHAEIKRVGNTAHAASCKFHSTNLDVAWPFNMH